MDKDTVIRTEDLTKTYQNGPEEITALDNANLEIPRGQLVTLYGPSGSGKTTLLFLLAGMDRPTSGVILIDGVNISNIDEKHLSRLRRRTVGFVFQNFNLVEDLTAQENIQLTMMFEGKPSEERRERTTQLLHQMGVDGRANRYPYQMSAGEQQRVAVARALANRPKLVLMDEPTGNLDRENSRLLMQHVTDTVRREKMTFIVATHNPEIVTASESRIFLRAGRIVPDGLSPPVLEFP